MSSDSEDLSPENSDENGCKANEDESMDSDEGSVSKRNGKRRRNPDDSDEDFIPPEYLMKVEVNEGDEAIHMNDDKEDSADSCQSSKKKKPKTKKYVKKFLGPWKCDLCFLEFTSKANLRRHGLVHKGDLQCPVCCVPVKSKSYLANHMSQVHQINDKTGEIGAAIPTLSEDGKVISNPHNRLLQRHELPYSVQNAVVSKMHKGRPVSDICQLYSISPEVVNEIWNDRDKFAVPTSVGRWSVKYMNTVLEPLVLEWYNVEKEKNVPMSGRIIQNAADRIARENGFVHFNAGNKWLEHFKKRNGIYLSTRKRDYSNTAPESKWIIKFFEEQWAEFRKQYGDDDIYCADEVGFFFNPSPTRTRKMGGKKFIHGNPWDRLSIMLCTNMSGTDKRKLLVCGSEDPLRQSYRKSSSLPVEYRRNAGAHITTGIFEEYIQAWNADLEKNKKFALLLLDRASIHTKLKLANLKLVFLPWKGGNTIMAIRNGIYQRFRSEFRNLLLEYKVFNALRGVDRHLTCLEALEMVQKAWERTPSNVITKTFLETGYEVQNVDSIEEITNPDNDAQEMIELLKDYDVQSYFTDLSSLDHYLSVDDELIIAKGTNASIFGGNHKKIDPAPEKKKEVYLPLNTDIPESHENELLIRKTKAIADLELVRKYLQSNDTSQETYCQFMDVEKAVIDNFVKLNNS